MEEGYTLGHCGLLGKIVAMKAVCRGGWFNDVSFGMIHVEYIVHRPLA